MGLKRRPGRDGWWLMDGDGCWYGPYRDRADFERRTSGRAVASMVGRLALRGCLLVVLGYLALLALSIALRLAA